MLTIFFKRLSALAETPRRMTSHAAGYDLSAALEKDITLPPLGRYCVPTGIALAVPAGFEAQIRPRSGLAIKHGIGILNSPGTIDADYRGEIMVILFNSGSEPFIISNGMRIAQMVISAVPETELLETDNLESTDRNAGGFGHTGY
jgi:dUTP pyrophosphatase